MLIASNNIHAALLLRNREHSVNQIFDGSSAAVHGGVLFANVVEFDDCNLDIDLLVIDNLSDGQLVHLDDSVLDAFL